MNSWIKISVFALLLAASVASLPAQAESDSVNVILDQAKILRLPERVATIVIGNPSIADGTMQAGGLLVVTGKGYGSTNLLALDRKGDTLVEYVVHVSGPKNDDKLTVWRGIERETWSCAPNCEHTVVLGDSNSYFAAATGQITSRDFVSAARK